MSPNRNLLVGLFSSIWTGLLGLIVVPLYLKYLGLENYGLIGFFAMLQTVLQLLDLGLAPTINRELARFSISKNMGEARILLRSLGVVYGLTALFIAVLIMFLAPFLADQWLRANELDLLSVGNAVLLMGLVIACRWPIALYQGALMGMQRLAISSSVNALMLTLGNLGAVAVLAWLSPTLEAFFIWQAGVSFVHLLVIRWLAWNAVGRAGPVPFELAALRRIWRFSAGMSGIALASIALTQLDKVLLSTMLSLSDYGKYALAAVLAASLYVLLTPVFNVVYSRMCALVASGETAELLVLYKDGTRALASVILPLAISIAFYANDLVFLWTGNSDLSMSAGPLVSLLILGTALNGVMHFPYALQLAHGRTKLPLTITTSLAVVLTPMIIVLTTRYGAIGSALAWLTVNVMYLFFGTWLTHRSLLKGQGIGWLAGDVGIPLCVTFFVVWLGWQLFHVVGNHLTNVLIACMIGILAIIMNSLTLSKSQKLLFRQVAIRF